MKKSNLLNDDHIPFSGRIAWGHNQYDTVIPGNIETETKYRHTAESILEIIFVFENCCISIQTSLKYFPQGPDHNKSTLVQVISYKGERVHLCIYVCRYCKVAFFIVQKKIYDWVNHPTNINGKSSGRLSIQEISAMLILQNYLFSSQLKKFKPSSNLVVAFP